MLMSASDPLLGVPRAFTIDSPNIRNVPTTTILPYSVSALDTINRSGESQGGKQSAAEAKTQSYQPLHGNSGHTSPFTLAPPEACAAFAGICAGQDSAPAPAQPHRCLGNAKLPGSGVNTGLKELPSFSAGFLSSTLSTFDSTQQTCCNGSPAPMDASAHPCSSVGGCQWGPPHGAKAVCGKRTTMEDAYAVQTNFFDLSADGPASRVPSTTQIGGGRILSTTTIGGVTISDLVSRAVDAALPANGGSGGSPTGSPTSGGDQVRMCQVPDPHGAGEMLHFFGVYDGHGGSEAAHHCATRLHHHLFEALSQHVIGAPLPTPLDGSSPAECVGSVCKTACAMLGPEGPARDPALEALAHGAAAAADGTCSDDDGDVIMGEARTSAAQLGLLNCGGRRLHRLASATGPEAPGGPSRRATAGSEATTPCASTVELPPIAVTTPTSPDGSAGAATTPTAFQPDTFPAAALREAFIKTDLEFGADASAAVVGSTAVVALLGSRKMWVANCGDSRAVLCQGGKAVQLTEDHKPERKDEAERVEKAGGHVLYWNGHRVMGILAMSRAIGDHGLRPYIIPEPEISVVTRSDDDEFLLLASDGLWDVMTNQEATDLAARCLMRAIDKGASRKAAVRISASVLTKAAIDRGSKDNVTVVMVDLKDKGPEGDAKVKGTPDVPGGVH